MVMTWRVFCWIVRPNGSNSYCCCKPFRIKKVIGPPLSKIPQCPRERYIARPQLSENPGCPNHVSQQGYSSRGSLVTLSPRAMPVCKPKKLRQKESTDPRHSRRDLPGATPLVFVGSTCLQLVTFSRWKSSMNDRSLKPGCWCAFFTGGGNRWEGDVGKAMLPVGEFLWTGRWCNANKTKFSQLNYIYIIQLETKLGHSKLPSSRPSDWRDFFKAVFSSYKSRFCSKLPSVLRYMFGLSWYIYCDQIETFNSCSYVVDFLISQEEHHCKEKERCNWRKNSPSRDFPLHSRGFDSTHKTSYKTISWSKDIQRESLKQQSSLFLDFLDFPHSSQKCIAGKVFADLRYCYPLPLLTCSSWLWMAADRGCCKLCWFFAPIPIRPDADAAEHWDCRSPEPVSSGAHIARFQSYLSKCGACKACRARGGGDRKWIFWFTRRTRSQWRLGVFWLGFHPNPSIFAVLLDSIGWHRNVFHPSAIAGHQHLHPTSVDHDHIRNTVCYHLRVHDAGQET